jgi:hypothetical protein
MAYLHAPRLVFSGDFLSDVSTVNNDPAHYNNATFKPNFQEPGVGATNGWWNPEGGAIFDLRNCRVQHVTLPVGTTTAVLDMVIGQMVGGPGDKATGKMVDLDPQEQGSSELWTVMLRIYTANNELLLQGDLNATPFRDLQLRQQSGSKVNGQPLGASWTSVLTNLVWGPNAGSSPFLSALRNTTQGNKLSINLNAFGYYYNHAPDGRFSMGKIIGCIGPWFNGEPDLFAPARRLYGIQQIPNSPWTLFGYNNFLVSGNSLSLDLGNSFPIADALGTITFKQKLILGISKQPINAVPDTQWVTIGQNDFTQIADINYENDSNWLLKTGGIVQFNNLPTDIMEQLAQNQLLLLTTTSTQGSYAVIAREAIDGLLVRADNFVQRIDADETNNVRMFAYQWGKPLAHSTIVSTLEPPTPVTPLGPNNPISEVPGNNYPTDGITFPPSLATDASGFALLPIHGNRINNPRGYIDGQIYTLDIQLQNIPNDPAGYQENIFVHLRDYYKVPDKPVWSDIAETMTQYGNLYPLMSRYIASLADPVALQARKDIFLFAFSRDINDVMHMPVTRDLSNAKRQTILKWLASPADDAALEKTATAKKELVPSPAAPNTALTTKQQHLKALAKAKSGSDLELDDVENLFENL